MVLMLWCAIAWRVTRCRPKQLRYALFDTEAVERSRCAASGCYID